MRTKNGVSDYRQFLDGKRHEGVSEGFEPTFMPDSLFAFQRDLVRWAVQRGRAAIFADCGLGKTPMQLAWAENVARHTNKPVLVMTPLAVSHQTMREGEKFGIACQRSSDGIRAGTITVTNYERIHLFDPSEYAGVVLDESSILKSFDGARRKAITDFMRKIPYRLLTTATAAPNDYMELGTSSEALGHMGHMDMLNRFFKNDNNNLATRRMYGEAPKWRFKGHAERPFWRWVTSWARACRRPSDLGHDDAAFVLPPLNEDERLVDARNFAEGHLFNLPARDLFEQREERKRTIHERCERVAELVSNTDEPALVWCHLNEEGRILRELIPDAIEVAGGHSDEQKEDRLASFAAGQTRVLITKPKIGAWGLNFQHCAHVTFFPSHSYEQYYQAVRRCWRFGQTRPVQVDLVMTEGDRRVMANLKRKSESAEKMFSNLIAEMNHAISLNIDRTHTNQLEAPLWL